MGGSSVTTFFNDDDDGRDIRAKAEASKRLNGRKKGRLRKGITLNNIHFSGGGAMAK